MPTRPADIDLAAGRAVVTLRLTLDGAGSVLEARVEPDGHIQHARVLRSIPILDQAALAAVLQWEFAPTLPNGAAVPVLMTVTVQFTLPG